MISNKFSSKTFLGHRVRSHWYLSLISAIVFFLSGPLVLLWSYNNTRTSYSSWASENSLYEELVLDTARFFNNNGVTITYVVAYILATIIGILLFSYLNNQRQINFYHSQPISRKKLFLSNYFAGLLLGIIPMLSVFLISIAIAASTVAFGAYVKICIIHAFGFIAFYVTGLSITALACQISGSTLFSIYTVGFLNFFIPAIGAAISSLITEFSDTIILTYELVLKLSPVTYFLSRIGTSSNVLMFSILQSFVYIAISLLISFIALLLYHIRPSESSGSTIVFKPIGAFIKYISAFVFATGFGFLYAGSVQSFSIFILSFASFIFLSCLFMEVAYKRSFRNMKSILPSTIIATIIAVGGIHGISALSQSLDLYVPEADKIDTMSFNITNNFYNQYNVEPFTFDDPSLIKESIDVINKVVANSNFSNGKINSYVNKPIPSQDQIISIHVSYNDSFIERTFIGVDASIIMNELSSIYENPKYKEALLSDLITASTENTLNRFGINSQGIMDGYQVDYYYYADRYPTVANPKGFNQKDAKYAKQFIDAYIKDINDSTYADILRSSSKQQYLGNINMQFKETSNDFDFFVDGRVLESFTNTIKVTSALIEDPDFQDYIILTPDDKTIKAS